MERMHSDINRCFLANQIAYHDLHVRFIKIIKLALNHLTPPLKLLELTYAKYICVFMQLLIATPLTNLIYLPTRVEVKMYSSKEAIS